MAKTESYNSNRPLYEEELEYDPIMEEDLFWYNSTRPLYEEELEYGPIMEEDSISYNFTRPLYEVKLEYGPIMEEDSISYNSTQPQYEKELEHGPIMHNASDYWVNPCESAEMPGFKSFVVDIDLFGCALIAMAGLFVLVIMFMYLDTLRHVLKNTTSRAKISTCVIISVYPVVALVTFCPILVPRAHLLAETAAQAMFMCAMYLQFCMFIAYCGGEAELIRTAGSEALELKALPSCCWPCCVNLSRLEVNTRNLRILRLMVLQLPVVHGIIYLFLLAAWAQYQKPYQVNVAYIQPFTIASILTGILALTILINIMKKVLTQQGYSLYGKLIALQLVPVSAQLLGLSVKVLVMVDVLPCKLSITPTVFAGLLFNSLQITEIMVLSVWTRTLYKRPLPDIESAGTQVGPLPQVYTELPTNIPK